MIFAFDLPITPVRAMALEQTRPADRDKLGFSPLAAERVWAWDPKTETLKVFLKPDSFVDDADLFKDLGWVKLTDK